MPQLPSGRHVAFSNRRLSAPEQYGLTTGDLERIETVADLAPFIDVQLMRAATLFDAKRRAARLPLAPGSNEPPAELVAYDSGYTLADLEKLTAGWSSDDAAALNAFVAGKRFQMHLRGLLRQILIATDRVTPTFVDAVLYHPETRALFERTDD